jgi:hypothetical protein
MRYTEAGQLPRGKRETGEAYILLKTFSRYNNIRDFAA